MSLCTVTRGPNPSLAMEASVEQIFGGRPLEGGLEAEGARLEESV